MNEKKTGKKKAVILTVCIVLLAAAAVAGFFSCTVAAEPEYLSGIDQYGREICGVGQSGAGCRGISERD